MFTDNKVQTIVAFYTSHIVIALCQNEFVQLLSLCFLKSNETAVHGLAYIQVHADSLHTSIAILQEIQL